MVKPMAVEATVVSLKVAVTVEERTDVVDVGTLVDVVNVVDSIAEVGSGL